MSDIFQILITYPLVHLCLNGTKCIISFRPDRYIFHDPFQIFHSQLIRFHIIISQILTLATGIASIILRTKETTLVLSSLPSSPRPQISFFLLLVLHLREITVSPLNSEQIILAQPRNQIFQRNSITGLRHVIKAGIIHDRRRVSMFFHIILIPDLFDRISTATIKIMS